MKARIAAVMISLLVIAVAVLIALYVAYRLLSPVVS